MMFRNRLNGFRIFLASLLCWGALAPAGAQLKEEPWVRVRLFADRPVHSLTVQSTGGVRILGQTIPAPLKIEVEGGRLHVTAKEHFEVRVAQVRLTPGRNGDLDLAVGR